MAAKLVPSVVAIFDLATIDDLHHFPTLDDWLVRPLWRKHAEALSPEAKQTRRLAQIRVCRARKKLARQVAAHDAPTMTAGGALRDIIRTEPDILPQA